MTIDYLYSLGYHRVEPGLSRVKALLKNLQNPQDDFKSIHIAGTNGKGSVSEFITSILVEAGFKVGTFTSPHLVDFRERIRINDKMIPAAELEKLILKIKPFISEHTFFEAVTAIAFEYFKKQKVDYAVVEVGMGGRLDATNVLSPKVSIITNIGIDHVEHLGKTIDEIAYEKSGIIKNVPLVTTKKEYITKKCDIQLAKPYFGEVSMKGSFQHLNAGVAKKTAEILKINKEFIKSGLKKAYWPGRLDYVKKNLVFDCAHNAMAAKCLAREIQDAVFVLGIMKDKDIKGMCREFSKAGNRFIACRPEIERSAEPSEIAKYLDCEIIPDLKKGIQEAMKSEKLVCVTGSIFTIGEAFKKLGLKPFNTHVDEGCVNECKEDFE
ncbi:MAG: bifunctional folylpolyglutamate synthase/dihydrofolate synthase [Nanobdellota archaeon]